jgi:superfamily II DNA or RNA helicase
VKSLEKINHLLEELEGELVQLNARRAELLNKITKLQQEKDSLIHGKDAPLKTESLPSVTDRSSQEAKITLFRCLFRGREDVFARRFENPKTGKKGYWPVRRKDWINEGGEFLPLTDEVMKNHLSGVDPQDKYGRDFTIGIYPLLLDETCYFLAVDFDKATWQADTGAFLETCKLFNVPAALEKSRSGQGGHIWIFFSEPVPSTLARKMGTFLLTRTMERRPEIGLDSYDRLFPSQDTLPKGGFGNLIALPLQRKPRKEGNSLFLDENFIPYPDQWAFLTLIDRMKRQEVERVMDKAENSGEILAVRIPVTDEGEDTPWALLPSKKRKEPPIVGPLPGIINLVYSNQIYVPKVDLTPSLRNRLIHLAAFQNPDFYRAQAMRLSTFGKPRVISCCEDYPNHLGLPRGCLDEILDLFRSLHINVELSDQRFHGTPIDIEFQGLLRDEQRKAADALLQYETGVLSASAGFGKTIVAAYMIAEHKVNTLVIVHRRQLLDQWIEALSHFLNIKYNEIGQIGSGKRAPSGKIDVAMVQSLSKNGIIDDNVGRYGYVIVDECHHISAVRFEQVVRQSKAKYLTGLSATVTRKDGHHPIIFMQCGPVRYRVDDRKQAEKRHFEHKVIIRPTNFCLPPHLQNTAFQSIQDMYTLLTQDAERNRIIIQDVIAAVGAGRNPVLLTERREHLHMLASLITPHIQNVIVMAGGMGKKLRQQLSEQMASIPASQPRLIIATGRYLGEGFDDDRLDTLFLTMPISWRGTLAQYAGRLHRANAAKWEVIIYDYVDFEIPALNRMYARRRSGYRSIGYKITEVDATNNVTQPELGSLE